MGLRVIVHVINEEPFAADIEGLPELTATYLLVRNPRSREGNKLNWVTHGVNELLYPMTRIAFLEVVNLEGEEPYTFFSDASQTNG
ncbi:MAG: hypothetical protein ABI068_09215 [Ktedonobacterales bacterium]